MLGDLQSARALVARAEAGCESAGPPSPATQWLAALLDRQLRCQALRERHSLGDTGEPSREPTWVARDVDVLTEEIPYEEFIRQYCAAGRPVVFRGMAARMVAARWDTDHIRRHAADCKVELKRRVPRSIEWGSLEPGGWPLR